MPNPNVLSQRYATDSINDIFSEVGKTVAERKLWIAVMKAQKMLDLDIPSEDIEKFENAIEDVDLKRIEEIEKITKHDVKAKIQSFIETADAGEYLHMGMTSRDLTDNVEQMQFKTASKVIFGKYVSVLRHFSDKMKEYDSIVLTARTHHQAAQPTLLGKRFAMWGEELLNHVTPFETFIERYPLRGIKGAVGTQFDMLTLLGNAPKVQKLEKKVAEELGFEHVLVSTGQVYPRSLDYALLSHLALLSAAPQNFAIGMRLMSGYDLVTEGFKEGQAGSTAMPHKMNTRSSERVYGLAGLLKMYADGASRISGDQWEEGDVSCSVVRRVIVPDALYTSDGLCETALTVLNDMGAYEATISKEVDKYLPFLATSEILMAATQAGLGREEAHKVIKNHSIAQALSMRTFGNENNHLAQDLAGDPLFEGAGITEDDINSILSEKSHFVGNAKSQILAVTRNINKVTQRYRKEAQYEPQPIL